jgi:hypothetical protein
MVFWLVAEDAENCSIQVAYFVAVIIIFPAGLEKRMFDLNISVVQGAVFKATFQKFGKTEKESLLYFTLKLRQSIRS